MTTLLNQECIAVDWFNIKVFAPATGQTRTFCTKLLVSGSFLSVCTPRRFGVKLPSVPVSRLDKYQGQWIFADRLIFRREKLKKSFVFYFVQST